MLSWRWLVLMFWPATTWFADGFSLLAYNVAGNGVADWSTNSPQVQAIGRQLLYLQPDIITLNEIPYTNSWQMTNWVKAYLPGYFLALNSGTDGYIRSAIAGRHPIARAAKWLDGVPLGGFGYDGRFTRDLFEAEIHVTDLQRPLHVFTTHLKAGSAPDDLARRGAEAGAISNFLVNVFLPNHGERLYVLTGDLNEDVNRPPVQGSHFPIQRLVSAPTGLRLTTPRHPVNGDDRTFSARTSPFVRYDYILPNGLLFSNIVLSQVFRTDLLNPAPTNLLASDSRTASDHFPVLMVFHNPWVFRVTALDLTNESARLGWESVAGRQYRLESTSDFLEWRVLSPVLVAAGSNLTWSVARGRGHEFFRVMRLP